MKKIIFCTVVIIFVVCTKEYVCASQGISGKGLYKLLQEANAQCDKAIDLSGVQRELKGIKRITTSDVSKIAADIMTQLGESMPLDSEIDFIVLNRLIIDGNISDEDTIYLAAAYSKGLIKGKSAGKCSSKRCFVPSEPIGKREAGRIVDCLFDEKLRYRLTDDYQLVRIDSDSYPKFADYYSYILEDYPNGYYDTVFNFMVNQAIPENALTNKYWKKYKCTTYKDRMTWDTAFSKIPYSVRRSFLLNYDSRDRLGIYSAYVFPCEYNKFAKWRNRKNGYLGMPLNSKEKQVMVDGAKDFVLHALNVDYRTIDENYEWQEFMLSQSITEDELLEYIRECKEDELILECSFAAADKSAVYYDRTPFTFKFCEGIVRVYAEYRIVSDNGKAFERGNLTIGAGGGLECLRDTTIDEAGERYIGVRNANMQEGYFDIGVLLNGRVEASMINNLRYRCPYIAALGYPCELPCNYPGTYTIKGMVNQVRIRYSIDEYMEKWGYLY